VNGRLVDIVGEKTMSLNPVKISITSLVVSILTLLVSLTGLMFGPALIPRVQAYSQARAAHERQVLEYLRQAAVFLDGLPLFIAETWAWGPGVPNYSPPTFPDPNAAIAKEMPAVKAAVDEALQLYYTHSQKQGVSYYSKEEALSRLSDNRHRFWQATEECVKAEWPWHWKSKMEELRKLTIPDTERDRIRNLKRTRQ